MTFAEFEDDYNDRINDAQAARLNDYALRLWDWLNLIDDSEHSRETVRRLEGAVDFERWFGALMKAPHPNDPIDWAADREQRLAQQLGLIREFAKGPGVFGPFALQFLDAGPRVSDGIERINSSLLEPLARDLMKYIKRQRDSLGSSNGQTDRVIVIDPSDSAYRELLAKLDEVKRIAETANSLAYNPAERDRVVAELDAGRRLLKAPQFRVAAVWEVLKGALLWMREKTGETVFAVAVTAAIALVAAFLGVPIPGL